MARDETELLEMGLRIKELRKSHGYKQQWIADQVGVELRTYQFWQAGDFAPEQENLEKLAALFGVTPKYILKGETPELLSDRRDQLDRIEAKLDQLLAPGGNVRERLAEVEEIQETERADLLARVLEVAQQLDDMQTTMLEIRSRMLP
jgi:transcriptional regulator with XRE-family HTH domain